MIHTIVNMDIEAMSDIVEWLRARKATWIEAIEAMEAGADEIEQLRRTLLVEREMAIADITELRAEIERLRGLYNIYKVDNEELRAEIEQLRAERARFRAEPYEGIIRHKFRLDEDDQ